MVYKFIQHYVDNLLGFDACGLRDEILQVHDGGASPRTLQGGGGGQDVLLAVDITRPLHTGATRWIRQVLEQEFLTGLLFQTYLCQHSCLAYLVVAFYYFGVCAFSIR